VVSRLFLFLVLHVFLWDERTEGIER
jgi:hypothetical protein